MRKCWAAWSTNWNQDCWEKYQQTYIFRWYHSNGRNQRIKETSFHLDFIMLHYTKFPCSSLVLPLFLSKFAFPLWIPNIGAVHGGSLVLFSWGFELLLPSPNILFDSLPHEVQHIRLPCPSLSNGVGSKSCPVSWWCHPTILSSVVPFSSRPQSFPGSRSFPMLELFLHSPRVACWAPTNLSVSCLFAFSCCSWGFQCKNPEGVHHPLLQWTMFLRTLHHNPCVLSGPTWHGS